MTVVGLVTTTSKTPSPTPDYSPIVPPTSFLYGVLTCQPYQGIYVNHIYFQLANAFFLLSHLAPSGLHGVLYLRCTLLVGCAFFALWAWTIVCWLDAALWNILFVIINFVHVCALLYRLRPVRFSKEIEEVNSLLCYHILFFANVWMMIFFLFLRCTLLSFNHYGYLATSSKKY